MGLPWVMNSAEQRVANSLRVWIPLVFVLFVILGSVGLLLVFDRVQEVEERESFAELAKVNVDFMERSRIPRTEQMASRLSEVLGAQVFFNDPQSDRLLGPPNSSLPAEVKDMEFDGRVAMLTDDRMVIGLTDELGVQMIFIRQKQFGGLRDLGSEAWIAVSLFWLLSMGLGLAISRWVSSPLQALVRALPKMGTDEDLPELPVNRRDEIGLLARVLKDTHQSLGEERDRRRQAERLALLGRMATGIAHEIRNPAAAIRLHAELLDASDAEGLQKSRGLILDESKRLENLVSQWMHYSRPEPPKTSEMDVSALLRDVMEVMQPQARHMQSKIEMTAPSEGDFVIRADRHRLHQVFSNLMLNAIQAMPNGGCVEVSISLITDGVEIQFKDEGSGFSEDALKRAEEPFFSEREGGLGLGLAVAKEICLAHGGNLILGNQKSGGACIRVELAKVTPQNEESA